MTGIALIGQGRMAKAHAAAWTELGLGENIALICTPRPGAPLEHAPNARFVTDLEEVLRDESIDIVSVCTPTPSHAEITVRALAAGKNVLLEKPIALTLGEAQTIAEAAFVSSGLLMVAHVVRFFSGYQRLRERAESGEFGRIFAVTATRFSAGPRGTAWLNDDAASGGVLVDFGIHDFDQVNLFLGTPLTVTAVAGETPGLIETTVTYVGGGIGRVLTCNEMPTGFAFSSSLDVVGDAAQDSFVHGSGSTESPYTRQAEYFLSCLRSGVAPDYCSIDDAILALRVSIAARESLQSGATVTL